MGEARDTAFTGKGRSQGVGKFLQVGGAGDSIVWVVNVVPFGLNGWDMGDVGVRRHTRGRRNPVG